MEKRIQVCTRFARGAETTADWPEPRHRLRQEADPLSRDSYRQKYGMLASPPALWAVRQGPSNPERPQNLEGEMSC